MLEDGTKYEGTGIGDQRDAVCEVVFNTAMCGYPELLTDPSYCGQAVVMTYPMVGNYGVCYDDAESGRPWVGAFIVHSLTRHGSNFRRDMDLDRYLCANHVPGIEGIDTRRLTRHLRERGTMRGAISFGDAIDEAAMLAAARSCGLTSRVPSVSRLGGRFFPGDGAKVALIDFGVKRSIITSLIKRGCSVQCFPHDVACEEIMRCAPDGVMLTNGPGDPQECAYAVNEIRKLLAAQIPMFAICLGHQLMALASGAQTERLKYGHRGINHPVRDAASGRVYITSQNHGYVVREETIDPGAADVSFVSMNDGSVEGLTYRSGRAFSVQFHPEAAPGPQDTAFLFDRFIELMGKC